MYSEPAHGAALATRVWSSLEAAALAAAAAALLARWARSPHAPPPPPPAHVLITNTSTKLSKEITKRLRSRGCRVSSVTSGAAGGAGSGAATEQSDEEVDALVIVCAEATGNGIDGLSAKISDDVNKHLKLIQRLWHRVRPGGRLVWVAGGGSLGAFGAAAAAFDDVIRAQLELLAQEYQCELVFVKRTSERASERVAERAVAQLLARDTSFVRKTAATIAEYVWGWFKPLSS